MMKQLVAAILLLMFFAPVYAESVREICAEEAREAGIEDPEEAKFYVSECVEQMTKEMESGDEPPESEMDKSEMEVPPATTEL